MNKKIAILSLIVILLVSAIAETMFYFNGEIVNLNQRVESLKSQISTLSGQVANLSSPYLVTALGIHEITLNSGYGSLELDGTVTNTGRGTAYNAGLLVVAYNNDTGALEINMTVPLSNYENFVANSSPQLGYLVSEDTVKIGISISHEGTVNNWTVTPV